MKTVTIRRFLTAGQDNFASSQVNQENRPPIIPQLSRANPLLFKKLRKWKWCDDNIITLQFSNLYNLTDWCKMRTSKEKVEASRELLNTNFSRPFERQNNAWRMAQPLQSWYATESIFNRVINGLFVHRDTSFHALINWSLNAFDILRICNDAIAR